MGRIYWWGNGSSQPLSRQTEMSVSLLNDVRHLIDGEAFEGAVGGCDEIRQVFVVHVDLPEFAGFPVFIEHEVRGVVVVLVHVVVDAAFLRECRFDELFELCFHKVDFVGLGVDVGNDGKFL